MTSPYLERATRTTLEAALDISFGSTDARRRILQFLEAVRLPAIVTNAASGPNGPRILYVNTAMCGLCGYPRSELVGHSPVVLQGPETDLAGAKAFRKELETHGRADVRLTNYRRDGTAYDVRISAGKITLGTPLDDDLRIAFETDVTADRA